MEQVPQIKIRGLDEALASIESLSRAIERVGFSAHLATLELGDFPAVRALTLPFDDYLARLDPLKSVDALQAPFATFLPEMRRLDEAITGLTSALALPQLTGVLGAISEATASIREASTAITNSTAAMTKAISDFKFPSIPPLQVFGISPEQLQVQLGALDQPPNPLSSIASDIGNAAISVGADLVWENTIIGSGLILGGLGLRAMADGAQDNNNFSSYDEKAAEHMDRVRGFGDIAQVEDGFIFSRSGIADARSEEFWKQFAFFSERLKELDKAADVELTPQLDRPGEFYHREQARALRSLYSQDFLELIDRYKLAVGSDPTKINAGPFGQLASPPIGIDADAYKIALAHGAQSADQITPSLMPGITQVQPTRMEPIQIQIKVLSDYRLSMRTVNPNPDVDVRVYCGLNGVYYGLP